MTPEEVAEYKRRQPFRPFRVFIGERKSHVVRHPSFIMVGLKSAEIGVARNANQIPLRIVHLSLSDVTRIELLKAKKTPKRRKSE